MFSINCGDVLHTFARPALMGILNVTPDSFYAESRREGYDEIFHRVTAMIEEGADIIDVGACSTRPGSIAADENEELRRLEKSLPAVKDAISASGRNILLSLDSYRVGIVEQCASLFGIDIVNDVSGGSDEMYRCVSQLKKAYVLMHTRGSAAEMQRLTEYADVTADIISDLAFKLDRLRLEGVADVIIDPGFGFAKTLFQNYELMANLADFRMLDCPIMAGVSRKSMVSNLLGCPPEQALEGTVALQMAALINGASILRVHDVKAAADCREIYCALYRAGENRETAETPGQ